MSNVKGGEEQFAPENENLEMLRAIYEFKAVYAKTISFEENEIFLLHQTSLKQRNWWQVINERGNIGFVPSNYVEKIKVEPAFLLEFIETIISNLKKTDDIELNSIISREQLVLSLGQQKNEIQSIMRKSINSDKFFSRENSSDNYYPKEERSKCKSELPPIHGSPSFNNSTSNLEDASQEFSVSNNVCDSILNKESVDTINVQSDIEQNEDNTKNPRNLTDAKEECKAIENEPIIIEEQDVYQIIEAIRKNTNLSHELSQLALRVFISEMEALLPEISRYLEPIAVHLTSNSLTVPDNLLGDTHDSQRLRNLFSELTDAKNDSEQRSWMLYEDEVDIQNYLTELIRILVDADPKICRYEMSCDSYNSVNNLVLYYQMESRWTIRKLLLKAFKAMCLLEITCVDILLESVLPLELVQDMLMNPESFEKLSELSVVLIMIFSAGHKMPIGHFDLMKHDFVHFILKLIENPLQDDQTEFLSDVMINLLLSFNLQFDGITENTVLEAMQQKKASKAFTEKILLLINREDDPVFVLKHTKPPMNTVIKILLDLFSLQETTNLFYTNDIKVLIDILVRQLSDLSAGDQRRKWYLELCRRILRNTEYSNHQHRALDLMKVFTRIFCEESVESIADQQIVREISNEFSHIFKA